ncbi:MAG: radical SAM/Cys-rich domain protein [Planctomycetes bacterium]|nr:radical SAM/Cys-rich domain protein [Planctomycetota bacterium]
MGHTTSDPNAFDAAVGGELRAAEAITTIQVNVGLTCNLACHHCHVVSGPNRTEQMRWATMEHVLAAAARSGATLLDITGGAPEMNPHFRAFVEAARRMGLEVMVRTNLTILLQADCTDLPGFFRRHRVHLVASLPCYLQKNVDQQRGRHVYVESIEAMKRLNAVGYGIDADLPLDLVYNPLGPSLPPDQGSLEADYRRMLASMHGVRFTRLLTITNMAIGRFLHDLERDGKAEAYQQLLRESFNPAAVDPLMCRHQLHVSFDGRVHDCDFNYALNLQCDPALPATIDRFDPAAFARRRIVTGDHCFGCTAGCGSSCGGALVESAPTG